MNKNTTPRKNKLPNCKYTPKQFAQRIDYFCRRLENLQNSGKRITLDIWNQNIIVTNNLCSGCVAGLFSAAMGDPRTFNESKQIVYRYLGWAKDIAKLPSDYALRQLGVSGCWPYPDTLFLASPEAYGKFSPDAVTLQVVIDTFKQFATNIRNTPESYFFTQPLTLISCK